MRRDSGNRPRLRPPDPRPVPMVHADDQHPTRRDTLDLHGGKVAGRATGRRHAGIEPVVTREPGAARRAQASDARSVPSSPRVHNALQTSNCCRQRGPARAMRRCRRGRPRSGAPSVRCRGVTGLAAGRAQHVRVSAAFLPVHGVRQSMSERLSRACTDGLSPALRANVQSAGDVVRRRAPGVGGGGTS